jgi:phosphatidylserine/phosphatidylglycerophosphate/cardiolipin synthase-like enzyme
MSNSTRAYLVESIPKGLEDLRGTPGVAYTEDVLVQLTSTARSSIDLTAMYWALLVDPGSDDEKGFTPEQLDAMGAGTGRALCQALQSAAQRGVRIRIVQSPGFSRDKRSRTNRSRTCCKRAFPTGSRSARSRWQSGTVAA